MLSKPFWVVGFVCLALGATLAQDPTKVEPTHYKLAFENEWVQVVNIHYGPHEKSGDTAYNAVYIGIKAKAASVKAGKGGVLPASDAQTEKILVSVKR